MKNDLKEKEIAQLKRLIKEQNIQTSSIERERQNMRNVRGRLDFQIDIFNQIHVYTQDAFKLKNQKELFELIPEGIVDVFQLEVGAVFGIDVDGVTLNLIGSCNLETQIDRFTAPKKWLAELVSLDLKKQKGFIESPVKEESPLSKLGLMHAVYIPMYDNDRKIEGLILGGITVRGSKLYDFNQEELFSSFIVYCQQMNGIYNNLEAIALAKSAGEAKNRFLANLSHEIRTPMNAIIGMVQIADRSKDYENIKKCISQIDASSKHLLGLLNDVLDISKIEEGKLILNNEDFSLNKVIRNIFNSMKQSAEIKNIDFTLNMDDTFDLNINGDSMRLSQVLINIISNAVKFTGNGGKVSFDVDILSSDNNKALINFSVTDTGIGIPEEMFERIFNPFEQADGSTSRKFGGTGLGLAISRRIIDLMGSKINLDSRVGEGTRFYFSVWFDVDSSGVKEEEVTEENDYNFSGMKILIVDDIEINRKIICEFLVDTGAVVDEAKNGEDAVNIFKNSPEGYYDLIFMDVQMPVMDGYQATNVIRTMDRADSDKVEILAMTANVFKEDMQKVANAGMNGHVGKPVDYYNVMNMIYNIYKKNSN